MKHSSHGLRQHGITLIELLVGIVLASLVALAAIGTLLIARQGFTQVDATTQLRDNARFAQTMLEHVVVQAGYRDVLYAATSTPVDSVSLERDPPPAVFGLNNAQRNTNHIWSAGTRRTSTSAQGYGSDILVLRYQPSGISAADSIPDGSMRDCLGIGSTTPLNDRNDRMISIFHVSTGSDGEPALMCTRSASDTTTLQDTQPLVSGVEVFQVLYGVDGLAPGNTTVPPPTPADSVPDRYLRADQITVAGNDEATYANWRRVRSVRIGLVLRGAPGSALSTEANAAHVPQVRLFPLGYIPRSANDTGSSSAFAHSSDPHSSYLAPNDGRLRQVLTFTIHLRNPQEAL